MMTFKNEVDNSVACLNNGGLLIYPTASGWAIGCDASNAESITQLRKINAIAPSETLTVLVAHQAMMERFVEEIPEVAYDIFDCATKPTILILDHAKNLAANLAADKSVGVQIASSKFCQYVINKFKKPIVLSPLTFELTTIKNSFSAIDPKILKSVDYVVNLQEEKTLCTPSSIIKLTSDGIVQVIRE